MGDECVSPSNQLLGHCVIRELNEVQTATRLVFADVSVIQLHDNVVADNSLQITDSNDRQHTYRYGTELRFVLPWAIGRRRHTALRLPGRDARSSVCLCVRASVLNVYVSGKHLRIIMKLVTVTQCQIHMTPTIFSMPWVQRSRSGSDDHRNLVNSTAPTPLKGFEPELTQLFLPQTYII